MTLRWVFAALFAAVPPALDEAANQCQRELQSVHGKEPLDEARTLEKCAGIETKRERHLDASKRYADAARLSRSDLKYRRKLLSLRKRAADKAKAPNTSALANDVLEADRTLDQVSRNPRRSTETLEKTLSSLAEAAQAYRRDRDEERAEEAQALRALVLVRSSKPDDGLRAAEKVVAKSNASKYAAVVAHEARAWALLEKNDAEGAASAAIMFNHLKNPGGRSTLLERACSRFEKEAGAGKCIRLEIKLTGEVSFTDFSIGRRKQELSDDDIEKVHAQALPALEDCVLTAAKKEKELYRNVDIEISWAIGTEGQAYDVDVTPSRNKADIFPCAEGRLKRVRYPKVVSKEPKNVTIPYHLD
jgi:hypothetical protein